MIAVELFGEDHGGPAEVGSIFVDGFAEGKLDDCLLGSRVFSGVRGAYLAVPHHGGTCVQESLLAFGQLKELEGTCWGAVS